MVYRTKTYIAGDWDNDKDAVEKLHDWNNSKHWSLSFVDAHNLTEAKDSSLNCSIKSSLRKRMAVSKCFVLIVGDSTNSVCAGSCKFCESYNSHIKTCVRGHSIDYRSYIEYECELAVRSEIKIIVLYKSASVNKYKCPSSVRTLGIHIPMCNLDNDGRLYWDYQYVKEAFKKSSNFH